MILRIINRFTIRRIVGPSTAALAAMAVR